MINIRYLGHASFEIISEKMKIILDPFQDGSVPGLTFPKGLQANYVFCSHAHSDHNAKQYISLLAEHPTLDLQEVILPHDKEKGTKRGLLCGRIFKIDGISIAHLGDLGDISDLSILSKFKGVDILLAPINGFFTISSQEVYSLSKSLHPRLIIPMHYEDERLHTGYHDHGQINIFKELFPNYLKVKSDNINITPDIFKYSAVIFEK